MANGQFTESDGSNPYVFEVNPSLPYRRQKKEIGIKRYRLNNGSLKVYAGTQKEIITLNFPFIPEAQKDSMIAFYENQEAIRFYEDSGVGSYLDMYFRTDPKIQKDLNDETYTVTIDLEEL